jgi:hypothetical protein
MPKESLPEPSLVCTSPARRKLITGLGAVVGASALGLPGRADAFIWPWERARVGNDDVNLGSQAGYGDVNLGACPGYGGITVRSRPGNGDVNLGVHAANSDVNLGALPGEWLRREGRSVNSYASYIDSLRLQNITTQQVISAHAKKRGPVWNSMPPRRAWRSIGPTLKLLDKVSQELNVPVTEVVSVFRNPPYNARCPGAQSNSWHLRNYAVDVKMGAKPSAVSAMARRLRARGNFRGGVGHYPDFTHIDTRGTNADW